MPLPIPEPGLVICYSYLWNSEHRLGLEEGVKDRPCAIILSAVNTKGETIVTAVPITHSPPDSPGEAVEIPLATKRRLGLDASRSWIIANEVNRFVWPGVDLRPVSRDEPGKFDFGLLPPAIFHQLRECFAHCARRQRLKITPRGQ